MNWTKKPPTDPGWYQAITKRSTKPEIVYVSKPLFDDTDIYCMMYTAAFKTTDFEYWGERIELNPPPEMEKS